MALGVGRGTLIQFHPDNEFVKFSERKTRGATRRVALFRDILEAVDGSGIFHWPLH